LPARVLCTTLVVWLLLFPVTNVSAQDDLSEDRQNESAIRTPDTIDTPDTIETPDPIRTAEQSLTLGGGDAETAMPGSGVSVFSIFRILLTLAVVAAAIYGLVYFLKFRRASRARVEQDPFLKILASAPLTASRSVHVVSVGPQAWLVGSAENGVNLINEIGDKDTINAMLIEDSKRIASQPIGGPAGPLLDFRAILGKLGISAKNENSGPDEIRKRSERLKGL
jgi:flagellar protein FliO/FliZ